jgi:hypothetical protein
MPDSEQLRQRATRLLAMALKARDGGQQDLADRLTEQASELFDEASALETHQAAKPEAPAQPAQQQQQPQPKTEKD